MQYVAVILALAGAAVAQNIPACAAGPVQSALTTIGGPTNIKDLCQNKNGVLTTLTAALEAACTCEELNAAIALAGQFCTDPPLNIPKKDCSATSSASVTSAPATSAPVSSASASPTAASTTITVSVTTPITSVSGVPTPSSNGTVVSPPPSSTSVVVGSGSALQIGGVAMVGAFLAALAL